MRNTQKRTIISVINSSSTSSSVLATQKTLPNAAAPFLSVSTTEQLSSQINSTPKVSCLSEGHTLKFDSCPASLASEFTGNKPDKVLVITYQTKNDMAKWSNEMEVERKIIVEKLKNDLTQVALEVSAQGFWADAINPTTGKSIFGSELKSDMIIESDTRFGALEDFEVEDLGCCTILKHLTYGTNSISGFVFYKQ